VIHPDRANPDPAGAVDVVLRRVADENRLVRGHMALFQRCRENLRIGFGRAERL